MLIRKEYQFLTVSGRFHSGAKLFKSVEGRKKNRGKNNPVCSMNYKIKQMHAVRCHGFLI